MAIEPIAVEEQSSFAALTLPDELPPITLIAYTRGDLLTRVLDALCHQTVLPPKIYAYVDWSEEPDTQVLVRQTIEILQSFQAIPVHLVVREKNYGCTDNVMTAISETLSKHPYTVVMEEDIEPVPCFFEVMSKLLHHYRLERQVFSVHPFIHFDFSDEVIQAQPTDVIVNNQFVSYSFSTWADRWEKVARNYWPGFIQSLFQVSRIPSSNIGLLTQMIYLVYTAGLRPELWDCYVAAEVFAQNLRVVSCRPMLIKHLGNDDQSTLGHGRTQIQHEHEHRYFSEEPPTTLPTDLTLDGAFTRSLPFAKYLRFWVTKAPRYLIPVALTLLISRERYLKLRDWLGQRKG